MAQSVSWFDIQENTFTRWCNDELKQRGMKIESMKDDLKNGLILINLMEIISGKSLGRYNKHPRIISQKMENLNIALGFIKEEGIKLVNVGADDLHTGNMRIILGLIWTLILRYEIKRGATGDVGDGAAGDDLLKWVQSKIPEYDIKGWKGKDWNSGKAVCALCEAVRPGTFPGHAALNDDDKLNNATKGIDAGETIGVDRLLYPEELVHPKVDKLALMTYIAQFRNLPDIIEDHLRCRAYGPGLQEGIVGEDAPFKVEVPHDAQGKLEVKVEGPVDDAKVNVTETSKGVYDVSYTPTTPGHYKIHVTLGGKHIPGSVFHVQVLEKMSLGGEGKITVFFSSTSGTQKGRADFFSLQRLFETKKIHLRPDFEPWVPVDLLERDDREAIFKKAGTRNLPIVFVDDVYQGDYDKMMLLEEQGKLDDMLKMENFKGKLVSEEEHKGRLRAARLSVVGQSLKAGDAAGAPAGASAGAAPAPAGPATGAPAPSAPA